MTPDAGRERWIDKVLQFQTREIKKHQSTKETPTSEVDTECLTSTLIIKEEENEEEIIEPPPIEEETKTPQKKKKNNNVELKCDLCPFVTMFFRERNRHVLMHKKPYECGICDYRGKNLSTLRQHFVMKHPGEEIKYKLFEYNADDSLKRKREETTVNKELLLLDEVEDEDLLVPINKGLLLICYTCGVCNKKFGNVNHLKIHWLRDHDSTKAVVMKYKIIQRCNTTGFKLLHRCKYCEFTGSLQTVKSHHLVEHPTKRCMQESVSTLKCCLCNTPYKKLQSLRKHFFQIHQQQNIAYDVYHSVVDGKPLKKTCIIVSDENDIDKSLLVFYSCTYCDDITFRSENALKEHHLKTHAGLECVVKVLKRYKCPENICRFDSNDLGQMRDHIRRHCDLIKCKFCPLEFLYMPQIQEHHVSSHPNEKFIYEPDKNVLITVQELQEKLLEINNEGEYELLSSKKFEKLSCDEIIGKIVPSEIPEPTNKKRRVGKEDKTRRKPTKRPVNEDDDDSVASNNKYVAIESPSSTPIRRVARKSTGGNKKKMVQTARKSTTPVKKPDAGYYSFYGTKPVDLNDYGNVKTEANLNGNRIMIKLSQLAKTLMLSPRVVVKDVMKDSI